MDLRRTEFEQAEHIAKNILKISNNNFLDIVSEGTEMCLGNSYIPSWNSWIRMKGYRAKTDETSNKEACLQAAVDWIQGTMKAGKEAVFLLAKSERQCGIYYGTATELNSDYFTTYLPECVFDYESPFSMTTYYNGFITGSIDESRISDMLMSSNLDNCYVSCLLFPFTYADIKKRLEYLEENISYLDRYKSYQRVYGSATRRTEEIEHIEIKRAIATLKKTYEFIKRYQGKGLVRNILKFGAQNEKDYYKLADLICSTIKSTEETYLEPIRCFSIWKTEENWKQHIAVPFICVEGTEQGGFHPLSVQGVDSIAKFCCLPNVTCKGFFIKNYHINEDSMKLFESSDTNDTGIYIGKAEESLEKVYIPIDKLNCHMCVFGSAGGGKTTSVKKIVLELYKEKIPFLVIEAAKKEYVELIGQIEELRVYTSGTNGLLLAINPLEPEEGTLIENQVDMLVRAISAAHGNEHPIPEGMEGVLKMTYEKAGWFYGTMAYHDESRPFPTFEDVYKNVDEYVHLHAHYGSEVKQNLIAALTLRTENLYSGALGRMFKNANGISAEELLSVPTVIELDDFGQQATTFVMNVLMFKIQSYLARQPKSDKLERVLVVEEAHNVFGKSSVIDNGRDINNHYFDKMLAEIRASGTGIIISDQRPSVLSESVIANTAVKLIHAMEERTDRDIIARAIDLADIQMKKLRELEPGECIMSIRGAFGQKVVKVEEISSDKNLNSFCVMCTGRFTCKKDKVDNFLEFADVDRIKYLLSKVAANPYNEAFVNRMIGNLMEDLHVSTNVVERCCLLGNMLNRYIHIPYEIQRIVTNSYYKHIRKKV